MTIERGDPGPTRDPEALPSPALTLTQAAQDHLKAIWTAREWVEQPVTTTLLAERLALSPSTVSEQVRRLGELGLVRHQRYRPVTLTPAGEAQALRMVRRHRLLETYLVAELGYTWDEVHDEAEALEHVVSDLMLDRIDRRLGHPSADPHGDPIPSADGALVRPDAVPLEGLGAGETGVVARVDDRDPAVLRWCEEVGLRPGVRVRVQRRGRHRDVRLVAELAGGGEHVSLTPAAVAAVLVVRAAGKTEDVGPEAAEVTPPRPPRAPGAA